MDISNRISIDDPNFLSGAGEALLRFHRAVDAYHEASHKHADAQKELREAAKEVCRYFPRWCPMTGKELPHWIFGN